MYSKELITRIFFIGITIALPISELCYNIFDSLNYLSNKYFKFDILIIIHCNTILKSAFSSI